MDEMPRKFLDNYPLSTGNYLKDGFYNKIELMAILWAGKMKGEVSNYSNKAMSKLFSDIEEHKGFQSSPFLLRYQDGKFHRLEIMHRNRKTCYVKLRDYPLPDDPACPYMAAGPWES